MKKRVLNFVKRFPLTSYALMTISLLTLANVFNFQYDEPVLGVVATVFGIGLYYMVTSVESVLVALNIVHNSVKSDHFHLLVNTALAVLILFLLDVLFFHVIPKLLIRLDAVLKSKLNKTQREK